MASTFAGLSITSRGLNAAQVGLTVTTNNMSNIDTEGYSRQVVSQTSIGPAAVYSSSSLVGSGVEVTSVDRVSSFRLNQKYWAENSAASELEAEATYLEQIEEVFGTSDSSDISEALDALETALGTLADDPTDESVRASVLEYAEAFCDTLNTAAEELESIRSDLNNEVYTAVEEINSYASQIAELNSQIVTATASGASTNELEDARDVLIDELSSLADISVTAADDGSYTITVDGITLVKGDSYNELECYTVTDSTSDSYGMYGIRWAESGDDFDAGDSGALAGYLEMRDGSTADSKGVVYYMNQLDEFAQTFAQALNEGVTDSSGTTYSGNVDGYGLDDSTGIRLFTYDDLTSEEFESSGSDLEDAYSNITAANISVSKDVQDDTNKIAASSASGEESNTENLDDIISICSSVNVSGTSTLTDLYNVIVATVGGDSATTQTAYASKSATATYIDTSRTSVSGVSSDEETINLTTYQSAYAASASMVSAWSELYDTTISMVDD